MCTENGSMIAMMHNVLNFEWIVYVTGYRTEYLSHYENQVFQVPEVFNNLCQWVDMVLTYKLFSIALPLQQFLRY